MPRLLFEKTGNAVWISHLDLMRLFQRAFKRACLPLKHTQGFNPRPSVSIALPLSVGVESQCELLDFELEGMEIPCEEILARLNPVLTEGVRVLKVYNDGQKLKHLALMKCCVTLDYDTGIRGDDLAKIRELFGRKELIVEKKGKNGPTDQDIIPMIRSLEVSAPDDNHVVLNGLICCQNPTLNPMQLAAAISTYLPELKSDFVRCRRLEIYDTQETIFR